MTQSSQTSLPGRRSGLEGMRDLLRGSLARSLRAAGEEDRLAAAWTVVCGRTLAGRGSIAGYQAGVLQVEVVDRVWLRQLSSMRNSLATQLAEASGVVVHTIEFKVGRKPTV